MGSLTRMRARNRLQTALEQRLATVDTPAAKRAIYQNAVDRLCRIAIDDVELDRLAREFAVDPESISFPDSPGESPPTSDGVPSGTPERAGYEATCVDERRLGDTVEATVRCYDDGAILLFDSAHTESPASTADAGVVVLSPTQATAFVRLVRRFAPQDAEADARVDQLPISAQHSLGIGPGGEEVLVKRHSTSEVGFASPQREQECCLYTDQAQDLFAYFAERGFGRRPVVLNTSAAGEADQGTAALEPTVDLAAAGWAPGEACPACEHPIVHAIVRAGMQFHADGGWDFDETLAIYEAFCPECDWLPPVGDGNQSRVPDG